MPYIVKHMPDRSKPDEYAFFGPVDSVHDAERLALHMDGDQQETRLSVAFELHAPSSKPSEWPRIISAEEAGIVLGEKP